MDGSYTTDIVTISMNMSTEAWEIMWKYVTYMVVGGGAASAIAWTTNKMKGKPNGGDTK